CSVLLRVDDEDHRARRRNPAIVRGRWPRPSALVIDSAGDGGPRARRNSILSPTRSDPPTRIRWDADSKLARSVIEVAIASCAWGPCGEPRLRPLAAWGSQSFRGVRLSLRLAGDVDPAPSDGPDACLSAAVRMLARLVTNRFHRM